MPLRDRLREEMLRVLYEEEKEGISVLTMAKILNVHWQTAKKMLEELVRMGFVTISKKGEFPFKITASLTKEGESFAFELFSTDEGKLSLTERLLLIIIYVVGGEVRGTTKLEKLPFLLERDFKVELGDIFKHSPYLYGPYSTRVIDAVNSLQYNSLLNVNERVYRFEVEGDKERVIRIYTLTLKGNELAKSMFQKLPEELKKRLVKLRSHAQKSTKRLLDYVYTKYPEFKKYTTLDEF